jgi:hypothetical protein
LAHLPGHYLWAHPFRVQHLRSLGREETQPSSATISAMLLEWLGRWVRSPPSRTLELWQSVRQTGDPNIEMKTKQADVFLSCWPNPSRPNHDPPRLLMTWWRRMAKRSSS